MLIDNLATKKYTLLDKTANLIAYKDKIIFITL